MDKILFIAFGSALGGVARYLVGKWAPTFYSFPWGTFIVNIIGCFLIGLIYGLIAKGINLSENARLFLTVGFCGGFTTFSTYVHDCYGMMGTSDFLLGAAYAAGTFFLGMLMAYAGHAVAS